MSHIANTLWEENLEEMKKDPLAEVFEPILTREEELVKIARNLFIKGHLTAMEFVTICNKNNQLSF